MSTQTTGRASLKVPGFNPYGAWAVCTPQSSANPTIVSNFGFASIVRSGAGQWDFTLAERVNEPGIPEVTFVKSDTNYHEFSVSQITSTSFRIVHLTGAYGASPVAADTTGLTSFAVFFNGEQN